MDSHQQPTPIYVLWQEKNSSVRERILDLLPREDVASLRLASSACCNITTRRLFKHITVTFTPNTFTKASRVQALSRVGHHVEHLTFHLAHSPATFLPPLVHPETGKEISFLYTPHTSMASVMARPKYANTELGEILTQQYPPLFHAATNVPSFINALRNLPELRRLTLRTPGQDPRERYRRDAVDYALVSLRIALERAPLSRLDTLNLSHLHPSALHYLRFAPGGSSFGALPSSPRRWRQIRKLSLAIESWDFDDPASPGLDHLRIVDDYLRALAPRLEKLSFSWLGRRGPCPLALHADPLFAPPRGAKKLFNEVTSPMSPLPPAPGKEPLHFPGLRRLAVRNVVVNAPQVEGLVSAHRDTVKQLDFEDAVLAGSGSWEEALAPLTGQTTSSGSGLWSQRSGSDSGSGASEVESCSLHTMPSRDELPSSPSAAVAVASRDLFDYEFARAEPQAQAQPQPQQTSPRLFGEIGDDLFEDTLEGGPREHDDVHGDEEGSDDEEYGEQQCEGPSEKLEADLAGEIASAREQGMAYTTKLRKRRRRKHPLDEREDKEKHRSGEKRSRSRSQSRSHSRHGKHKHKHHRHRDEQDDRPRSKQSHQTLRTQPSATSMARSDSTATNASGSSRRRHRRSPPTPPAVPVPDVPPLPESLGNINITPPIMDAGPPPVLLQPAVYNPSRGSRGSGGLGSSDSGGGGGISSVQRNIEREEAQREMAEDAEARTSALRKAKAAVLSKLSEQFFKKQAATGAAGGLRLATSQGPGAGAGAVDSCAMILGARMREGLFGKSCVSVLPDERGTSTQSALVPLMFTRS